MIEKDKIHSVPKVEEITPNDGYNYFFGYYDLQPFDKNTEKHLTHRVTFNDRLQNGNDVVEIGYILLKDKSFHKIADSRAWNFQQGTLLQWFDEKSVIYNDFLEGKYCSVVKDINGKTLKIIDKPLAHISADRKYGLSINFPRVYDFRPGYGYCNTKDEFYDVNAPENDGIFLVDIEKNESKLIINYKQLAELFPEKPYSDMKLVVNHITFNPSASRFLFLLRNFPEKGKIWGTILITADKDGKNIKNLTDYEVNSHYYWKNDEEIIIYSGLPKWGIYFINDKTGEKKLLDNKLVNADDIHCIYSPDRSCFIGDGYPDKDNYRHIFIYDFARNESAEILKIYSHPVNDIDIRCDLHNRFNRSGSVVSFDSFHSDKRSICMFDFRKEEFFK